MVFGRFTQDESGLNAPVSTFFTPTFSACMLNTSRHSRCFSIGFSFARFHTMNATGNFPLLPAKFSEENKNPRSAVYLNACSRSFSSFGAFRYFSVENKPRYAGLPANSSEMRNKNCENNSLPVSPSPRASISFLTAVSETPVFEVFPCVKEVVLLVANGGLIKISHLSFGFSRSFRKFSGIFHGFSSSGAPAESFSFSSFRSSKESRAERIGLSP